MISIDSLIVVRHQSIVEVKDRGEAQALHCDELPTKEEAPYSLFLEDVQKTFSSVRVFSLARDESSPDGVDRVPGQDAQVGGEHTCHPSCRLVMGLDF